MRGKTVEPSTVVPPSHCTRNQPVPVVDDRTVSCLGELPPNRGTQSKLPPKTCSRTFHSILGWMWSVDANTTKRKEKMSKVQRKRHVQHRAYRT